MMGRTHCWSGAAAGLALAPAVGLDSITEAAPFAAVVAGYALVPDLDCHGATASRLLGPVTGLLSRGLSWCSTRLYQATRGPRDEGGPEHGGHRHMTHCALWCVLIGLLAWWTSTLSPWAVLGWLAFGVLAASDALGDWVFLAGGLSVALPMLLHDTGPVAVLAGMQGWIGLAVGGGCLIHVLGDMCTVSGCPLLFPLVIRGETWQELHVLPWSWRLHTGKKGPLRCKGLTFETRLVRPAFIATAAAVALTLAGAWPLLADLVHGQLPDLAALP